VQRRAYQVPINGRLPVVIDNDHFAGHFLMLHRTPVPEDDGAIPQGSPYQHFFKGRSRRWEVRVQGRFKKKPHELYTGCILEDFDYTMEHSWSVSALAVAVVPLMEAVMGQRFYFSWGTRGEHVDAETAELATMVTSLSGLDQIIVSTPDQVAPGIQEDIAGLGFCRNAMPSNAFRSAAQDIGKSISLENTYTFCVWGCSPYIDCLKSSFNGLFGLGSVSYEGFLDEWPAHFVLYGLEEDANDPRHLERRKTYYIDMMVWGSEMQVTQLPRRYAFKDERWAPESRNRAAASAG